MKQCRLVLYIQLIAMYAMQIPLYVIMGLVRLPYSEEVDKVIAALLIASLVLALLSFPICIVNAIFSILSIFKGEESPSKATMIVKLALIPWYVMNFFFGFLLVGGFMNPWLIVAVPLLVGVLVGFTYVFMLSSGLPDMAYLLYRGWKYKEKPSGLVITGIVFLFFFCLDILGSVFIHFGTKQGKAGEKRPHHDIGESKE